MNIWAIIVAAGSGARFGTLKQFELLKETAVVSHATSAFFGLVDGIVLVADPDLVPVELASKATIVKGTGETRSDSVRDGLGAVPETATHILIHDGARPLVSAQLVSSVIDSLSNGSVAVVPALPVRDTLRKVGEGTVDRKEYQAVQTPQGFSLPEFRTAHESGKDATDDAALMEILGHVVATVPGEVTNIKITYPSDIAIAEAIYELRRN